MKGSCAKNGAEIAEDTGGPSATSDERKCHTASVARGRTHHATLLALPAARADAADAHRAGPRGVAAPPGPDYSSTPCRGADRPYGGGPPRPAAVRRRARQQYT